MATFLPVYLPNGRPLYLNLDHVRRIDRPQSEGETEKGELLQSAWFWLGDHEFDSIQFRYKKADFARLVKGEDA